MTTIHLVSHTHWDREWYLTFQQFRLKLVHLIDRLLGILENNPDYKHFLLDGQAIILEDYLQIRPEREDDLRRFIQAGRLLIGPWYVSPDEFQVSPESHVRNLLEGKRICQEFGPRMPIGYLPDTFGHIGQMPQILHGFGIESACFWRGIDDQPTELIWQSPDGTSVLLSYLRESYGNAANISTANPDRFTHEIQELCLTLESYSSTGHILLMNGMDHMEPSTDLTNVIGAFQKTDPDINLLHSSLPQYFDSVRSQVAANGISLPVVIGELRSPKRIPLLQSVLSTRIWIKQRNQTCESLLLKWVEPFSAWANFLESNNEKTVSDYPIQKNQYIGKQDSVIRYAWKLLIQCHPHDSICGTSIDQVANEMRVRFDQVDQINRALIDQNLSRISRYIYTTYAGDPSVPGNKDILSSIVVFNPNDQPQSGLVNLNFKLDDHYISLEIMDDLNGKIPYYQNGVGPRELISMTTDKKGLKQGLGMVNEGRVAEFIIRDVDIEPQETKAVIRVTISDHGLVDHGKWTRVMAKVDGLLTDPSIDEFIINAYSDPEVVLSFVAHDIPGHGYRCYWICGKGEIGAQPKAATRMNPIIKVFLPLINLAMRMPFLSRFMISRKRKSARRPLRIENEYFILEASTPDGSLTLTDKRSQLVYRGLNRFIDSADAGDLYNYSPPQRDEQVSAYMTGAELEEHITSKKLTIHYLMRLPRSLSRDRKSRIREKVDLRITSTLTLIPGIPRVDIHTEVNNPARDHRLKVYFPAPFTSTAILSDGHYELVKRPIGVPFYNETWIEQPQPEVPQRHYSMVTDGVNSLTIANHGLPEVEAFKNGIGNVELALTLLRCVGWLSRDDITTRKGHAGPMGIATPEAQMLEEYAFDYSIIPGDNNLQASIQQANAFTSPLKTISEPAHLGPLPSRLSFLESSNPDFVITAIKLGEDGTSLIVRGFNILSSPIQVKLKPYLPFKSAQRISLSEDPIDALVIDMNGQVNFTLEGKKIATIRLMN